MQVKDFYTPLEMELHEMINSIEANAMILKLKGQKLDDNLQGIIKKVLSVQFHLTNSAKKRMQKAIEKEEKLNEPRSVVCMHCNKQLMAIRTGTALNNGYKCNVYHCEDCNNDWIDFIPVDEHDRMKWYLNFITQTEKLSKEKKIEIPPAQIEEMRAGYDKMVELDNDVAAKNAAALQAENHAQNVLLNFKGSIQDLATKMNEFVRRSVANG